MKRTTVTIILLLTIIGTDLLILAKAKDTQ